MDFSISRIVSSIQSSLYTKLLNNMDMDMDNTKEKSVSIMHLNINSVLAKRKKLLEKIIKFSPDVICLNETKLADSSSLTLPGYIIYTLKKNYIGCVKFYTTAV